MMFINRNLIFSILFLITVLPAASCARKVEVYAPVLVRNGQYAYVQDATGRWLIVTATARDLDEAMKHIRVGPASVDKLNLWIVTPLPSSER